MAKAFSTRNTEVFPNCNWKFILRLQSDVVEVLLTTANMKANFTLGIIEKSDVFCSKVLCNCCLMVRRGASLLGKDSKNPSFRASPPNSVRKNWRFNYVSSCVRLPFPRWACIFAFFHIVLLFLCSAKITFASLRRRRWRLGLPVELPCFVRREEKNQPRWRCSSGYGYKVTSCFLPSWLLRNVD